MVLLELKNSNQLPLLTYAFANNVLESVKIKPLKTKIKKIIAGKLGVNLGFEL